MSFLVKDDAQSDEEEDLENIYKMDILRPERLIDKVFTDFRGLAKSQCAKLRSIPLEGSRTLEDYLNGSSLGWNQEIQITTRVFSILRIVFS